MSGVDSTLELDNEILKSVIVNEISDSNDFSALIS